MEVIWPTVSALKSKGRAWKFTLELLVFYCFMGEDKVSTTDGDDENYSNKKFYGKKTTMKPLI